MAVASAGPYAVLHLAPDRQSRQRPTAKFFSGRLTNCFNALKAQICDTGRDILTSNRQLSSAK